MKSYSLSHLADHTLLCQLVALVSQDRATTAALLAHLAEVDERKLYLPAAYSSMFLYCVHELRMSEQTAFRRIRVARTVRQFPAIFAALADGALNLTAVLLLTPHLAPHNCDELLAAAANKSKFELEQLIAECAPRADVPTLIRPIAVAIYRDAHAGQEGDDRARLEGDDRAGLPEGAPTLQLALEPVVPSSGAQTATLMEPLPSPVAAPAASRARLAPLAPGRFALQVTVSERTHYLLRYAQSLPGHAVPSGDVAQVLERALEVLVEKLEKQRFAAGSRTRPGRGVASGRYVPADIRRAVWQRDGGRCTFVSEAGKRCEARTRLELDHVDPVARDGRTSVDNLRLACRAHNQFAAECTFGAGFMREKRAQARSMAARARTDAKAHARMPASEHPDAADSPLDVIPWLRQLGCNAKEADRGAALCAYLPDASLEERLKVALRGLAPAHVRRTPRSADCLT